jgi:hypothetical protein
MITSGKSVVGEIEIVGVGVIEGIDVTVDVFVTDGEGVFVGFGVLVPVGLDGAVGVKDGSRVFVDVGVR